MHITQIHTDLKLMGKTRNKIKVAGRDAQNTLPNEDHVCD